MAFSKASVRDASVKGRRVLVRVDFNVPLKDGEVVDDTRIRAALPTLELLRERGAALVLASHLGRPGGKRDPDLSLAPVSKRLSELLGVEVTQAPGVIGAEVDLAAGCLGPGEVLLLENTRFEPGETKNDPMLAGSLASLAQVYVNDAFGAAHRAHASTEGVAHLLPAVAGRLMQGELEALDKALGNPKRPVCAVVGGAKVSTKLDLLGNLVGKVDKLIIGGGMANTFLLAQGIKVGKSLAEKDLGKTALEILDKAKAAKCDVLLPVDAVVAAEFKANAPHEVVEATACPDDKMILDVGPKSVAVYEEHVKGCATLVWNGPLGAFEMKPFDDGTVALARTVADLTEKGTLLSVAGGGDTVAALAAAGVEDKFSYVSTAGGAFLEWMEGKTLPGVAALIRAA